MRNNSVKCVQLLTGSQCFVLHIWTAICDYNLKYTLSQNISNNLDRTRNESKHVSALSYKTMQDISDMAKQKDKSNIESEDEVYRMTAFFTRLSRGNGLLSAAELINNPLFGDYHLITPIRKFVTDIYVIFLIGGNPRGYTRPRWAGPVGLRSPIVAPLH